MVVVVQTRRLGAVVVVEAIVVPGGVPAPVRAAGRPAREERGHEAAAEQRHAGGPTSRAALARLQASLLHLPLSRIRDRPCRGIASCSWCFCSISSSPPQNICPKE